MRAYMNQLLHSHELLYAFASRDIKIKYKQSIMGVLWALLMPMIIVSAGVLVRYAFARFSGGAIDGTQIDMVAVKAVAWAFFVSALRFGTSSLIGNSNLVTKIKFPKAVFPMAAVVSSLFDLCIASVAITVILLLTGLRVDAHVLWAPVLLFLMAMLVFGMTALLSVANLFFRDVKYIVEVIVTFAIFFTPVFYQASDFGRWQRLMLLNPVAPLLEGLTTAIVQRQTPPLVWVGYSALVGTGLTLLALETFAVFEPRFAENI